MRLVLLLRCERWVALRACLYHTSTSERLAPDSYMPNFEAQKEITDQASEDATAFECMVSNESIGSVKQIRPSFSS